MYYVIFNPRGKFPSTLDNEEGGIAGFLSWNEADEEAKQFDDDYIIVGDCTEKHHTIVCSIPVNPAILQS